MKIRSFASHTSDQRRAAAGTAGGVEQVRIEAAAFAVVFRYGAIETEGVEWDVAAIGTAHGKTPL
jgi:hypothetical protein